MIFSILIYRNTRILHFEDFNSVTPGEESVVPFQAKMRKDHKESNRFLVGMLSAVSGIVSMLSPGDNSNKFESFSTSEYRLDYFETLTGYKFAVLSEPNNSLSRADIRTEFERLYTLLFVPLVIRNPMFDPSALSGTLRESECNVFIEELRSHFQIFKKQVVGSGTPPSNPVSAPAPKLAITSLQPSLI